MRPVVYPSDWLFREPPPALIDFGRRFLAEGDSWFTIGTFNATAASNILFKLEFNQTTAVVNCAYPGDTLQHMVDGLHDVHFDRLLRHPRFQSFWEAILISAGGNDLIDAAQTGPLGTNGQPLALEDRILMTPAEAAANKPTEGGPQRFISDTGWSRLIAYMRLNFHELVRRRDEGASANRPLFIHTYAMPTARPSGIIGRRDGWLYPALLSYQIPPESHQAVTGVLFDRLRDFLLSLSWDSNGPDSLPHVHVFDSSRLAGLEAAHPGTTGASRDWVNEIHPSPDGYEKIGQLFGPFVDETLRQYPGS